MYPTSTLEEVVEGKDDDLEMRDFCWLFCNLGFPRGNGVYIQFGKVVLCGLA